MTPFLDAWKADLAGALEPRGARSELARWLAERTGSTTERWKVEIARTLNTAHVPSGETVLAVNHFLTRAPARARARNRAPKTRRVTQASCLIPPKPAA